LQYTHLFAKLLFQHYIVLLLQKPNTVYCSLWFHHSWQYQVISFSCIQLESLQSWRQFTSSDYIHLQSKH